MLIGESTKARRLFKIVSIVFAPQITPAYFFIALLYATGSTSYLLLDVPIAFASIVPLLLLAAFARLSDQGVFVRDRSKRYPLFYAVAVSYAIGFVILRYINAPFIITALMLAYMLNLVLAIFINRYVNKVSIHVWGISGPAVAILYSFGPFAFFLLIALAAFVGLSRIGTGDHTIEEVEIAILASILLTYLVIFAVPLAFPGII